MQQKGCIKERKKERKKKKGKDDYQLIFQLIDIYSSLTKELTQYPHKMEL